MFRNDIYGIVGQLAYELDMPELSYRCAHIGAVQHAIEAQERERLVDEITNKVLSRLSVSFETGDALKEIKALNKAINELGK